jgi:hypothetical protein
VDGVLREAREADVIVDDAKGLTSLYLVGDDDGPRFHFAVRRSADDDLVHCELDYQSNGFSSRTLDYKIIGRRITFTVSADETFDAERGITEVVVDIPPEVADMDTVASCVARLCRRPVVSQSQTARSGLPVGPTTAGFTATGPGTAGPRSAVRSRPGPVRTVIAVCVVIGLIASIPFITNYVLTPGQDAVRATADGAAYDLERKPVTGLIVSPFDVDEAVAHNARDARGRSYASELKVTDRGHDSRGDLYEITNSDGEHPVCLAVDAHVDVFSDTPSYPTATVTDGPC